MKYIDSEELIAEIKRRMKDYNASIEKYYNKQKPIKAERDSWKWAECKWFLNLINSLQQEQPSLPSNLDEAAEDIVNDAIDTNDTTIVKYQKLLEYLARAGAEWMAGQGETHELTVESPVLGQPMICCPVHADNGDKVVVQIRKGDIVI